MPPLKPEGLAAISKLLADTSELSYRSAGLLGKAFSKASQYIAKAPATGYYAVQKIGWNHRGERAVGSGRNVPRVDVEVIQGRAFGVR